MAQILTTGIVADIRGKLKGTVFSRNRAGNYIRSKTTPLNPQSAAQQAVRGQFGSISQAWRNLTQSQRNSWNAAVDNFAEANRFGEVIRLSGSQLHQRLNLNLLLIGQSMINEPPLPVEVPYISNLDPDFERLEDPFEFVASVNFTINDNVDQPIPAGFSAILKATPPMSPGINYYKNLLKRIPAQIAPNQQETPIPFGAYHNVYGYPEVGEKIGVEMTLISTETGQAGVPYSVTTFVHN